MMPRIIANRIYSVSDLDFFIVPPRSVGWCARSQIRFSLPTMKHKLGRVLLTGVLSLKWQIICPALPDKLAVIQGAKHPSLLPMLLRGHDNPVQTPRSTTHENKPHRIRPPHPSPAE